MTESRRWFLKWVCAPSVVGLLFIAALVLFRPSRFRILFLAFLSLMVALGLALTFTAF